MCGRFSLITAYLDIVKRYRVKQAKAQWTASYNIAPSSPILSIFEEDETIAADTMIWGFIPHWADREKMRPLINARAESISEKPSFKDAFVNTRCLIPADGFFEWRRKGDVRHPYYITSKDGRPFSFAGLYSTLKGSGDPINTATIITTDANELVAPIHDRMPVIIDPNNEEDWIAADNHDLDELQKILKPYPAMKMKTHPVSTDVNDPKHDSAGIIEPTEEPREFKQDQKSLREYF